MNPSKAAFLVLLVAGFAAMTPGGMAMARPVHPPRAKVPKTHRILANSKSVRINDAGEVITPRKP